MGSGTAPSTPPRAATQIPGMQQSNYLAPVQPAVRVPKPQLAPTTAYQDNIPSIAANTVTTPSYAQNDDYLYGYRNNRKFENVW